MRGIGGYFLSFFLFAKETPFQVGMILIKIIKEKVWRKKVNKAIHTSSGSNIGVRQRKITLLRCELGDFHESALSCFLGSQLLLLRGWLHPLCEAGPGLETSHN